MRARPGVVAAAGTPWGHLGFFFWGLAVQLQVLALVWGSHLCLQAEFCGHWWLLLLALGSAGSVPSPVTFGALEVANPGLLDRSRGGHAGLSFLPASGHLKYLFQRFFYLFL